MILLLLVSHAKAAESSAAKVYLQLSRVGSRLVMIPSDLHMRNAICTRLSGGAALCL